jgi:competence protein ComFC
MYSNTPKRQSHCLWCLKPLQSYDFSFLIRHDYLCEEHSKVANGKLKQTRINECIIHYLTPYSPEIASLMFRYKEHKDMPLGGCLFAPHYKKIQRIMRGKVAVIVPSSHQKTLERGFHPLKFALSTIGVVPYEMLVKQTIKDQKTMKRKDRILTEFALDLSISCPTKHVVLFDDVLTTGHSLLTCKALLEKQGYHVTCCVFAIHLSWLKGI